MSDPQHLILYWTPPQQQLPTGGIAELAIKSQGTSITKQGIKDEICVLGGASHCLDDLDALILEIIADLINARIEARTRFEE